MCFLTQELLPSVHPTLVLVLSGSLLYSSCQTLVQAWDQPGAAELQALYSSVPPIWLPVRPALNETAWFPKGNKSKCMPSVVAYKHL